MSPFCTISPGSPGLAETKGIQTFSNLQETSNQDFAEQTHLKQDPFLLYLYVGFDTKDVFEGSLNWTRLIIA